MKDSGRWLGDLGIQALVKAIREGDVPGSVRDRFGQGLALPGTQLGRFEVEDWIACGRGNGISYLARTPGGERVALKALELTEEEAATLARRAERLQGVTSVGVARTHGVEEAPGEVSTHVWVHEWIDGESLDGLVPDGLVLPSDAARVLEWGLRALGGLHEVGLCHGDLHRRSVVVRRSDRVLVLVGLETAGTGRHRDSEPGLPPEVRAGAAWDEKSDVYALSRIAAWVWQRPRPEALPGSATGVKTGKVRVDPIALREVLEKGLEPDPQHRWSAQRCLDYLEGAAL